MFSFISSYLLLRKKTTIEIVSGVPKTSIRPIFRMAVLTDTSGRKTIKYDLNFSLLCQSEQTQDKPGLGPPAVFKMKFTHLTELLIFGVHISLYILRNFIVAIEAVENSHASTLVIIKEAVDFEAIHNLAAAQQL